MNDDEKELLRAGADAAMKPLASLIEKLFGGSAEEIGEMWQDALKACRFKRQLQLLKRVQEMIAEAGFEPRRVPDNISIPLLNGAALEDDESLQERWAALLANASSDLGLS